MSNKTDGVHIT